MRSRLFVPVLPALVGASVAGCSPPSGESDPEDPSTSAGAAPRETGVDSAATGVQECDESAMAVLSDYARSEWDALWSPFGCGWAHVGGAGGGERTGGPVALSMTLALPTGDLHVPAGSAYTLDIGPSASFAFGESGAGTDELQVSDCIDTEATFVGDVFVADAGRMEVTTTYACSGPPTECTGDEPSAYFLLEASVFDVSLVDGAGERRDYDQVGPVHATVGDTACGG